MQNLEKCHLLAVRRLKVVLAGLTISIIPTVILYLFGQRFLIRGTSLAGIKALPTN